MTKKISVIILILALLTAGIWFYLRTSKSSDFEPLLKSKLQEIVKNGSNGLYQLGLDHIEVDILNSTLDIKNPVLKVDSTRLKFLIDSKVAPVDVFEISLNQIHIDGLNIKDLIDKRTIDLKLINLSSPKIHIYHGIGAIDTTIADTSTLYERIASVMGHFAVKNINIQNLDLTYHQMKKNRKIEEYKNVSMFFTDLLIDSTTQYDSTRFLYAKDARIYYNDFSVRTADSLYIFKIDSLELLAARKQLNLKGISLNPRGNKAEFSKKHVYFTDRYDMKIKTGTIENIDWYPLLSQESFFAGKLQLSDGTIQIYADRNKPRSDKSKVGNYPHQQLMKMDFPIQVPTVTLNNFEVIYEEVNPKNQRTGRLTFDAINGSITNITNISENIKKDKWIKLAADGRLMDAGKLSATFAFDLTNTQNGSFWVEGEVGPMNGTVLNPITKPMGMFEIESLKINSIKFHINGNDFKGNGKVLFTYNNLKVKALEENENNRLQKKGFLSFLANTFLIQTDNPPENKPPIYQPASADRDIHRSFFNLIWQTLFDGLKKNVTGFE